MSETQLREIESHYPPGTHPDMPPPPGTTGVIGWVRENLFSSWLNAILTLGAIYVAYVLISAILSWAALDAVASGDDQTVCRLAGSMEEYDANIQLVNWQLLQTAAAPSGLSEQEATAWLQRQEDSSKYLGRAESSFGTFNTRLVEAGDLAPAELVAIADRTDSQGLHAALQKSIADKDYAAAEALTGEIEPLVAWAGDHGGACWTVIKARINFFIFAFYPESEQWRPILTGLLLMIALAPLLFKVPYQKHMLWFTWAYPIIAFFLLTGAEPVLPVVSTNLWGGFLVTMVTGVTGIAASLPIGIVLALGRRSRMPIVRVLCIIFIECIRGVPLITLLFMASSMLQLFLPPGIEFDYLLRALIVVALFASAYMAEVIRGGLQAIPKGQYEAAQALGLSYWKSMRLIILPQALKITIPPIVNTFIGLFKDTTLLMVIGIYDFLGAAQAAVTDAKWKGLAHEIYAFCALIYFICCFSMSRYSIYLEKKLHTGHKRR